MAIRYEQCTELELQEWIEDCKAVLGRKRHRETRTIKEEMRKAEKELEARSPLTSPQ